MPVVGIVQAMAGGAGLQDRGIEGGGTEHQLPRRRAAQLLVQLLQADGGAHRVSLQLGLIHHHPHIGVEGSEVARLAPAAGRPAKTSSQPPGSKPGAGGTGGGRGEGGRAVGAFGGATLKLSPEFPRRFPDTLKAITLQCVLVAHIRLTSRMSLVRNRHRAWLETAV